MVTPQLEQSMRAAKMRVLQIYLSVVLVMAAISSQISERAPQQPVAIVNIAFWTFGCVVVFTLGTIWLRLRFRASHRLLSLAQANACRIQKIEVTSLRLEHFFPAGTEVDITLATGEHLAFGFWTRRAAETLAAELSLLEGGGDAVSSEPIHWQSRS